MAAVLLAAARPRAPVFLPRRLAEDLPRPPDHPPLSTISLSVPWRPRDGSRSTRSPISRRLPNSETCPRSTAPSRSPKPPRPPLPAAVALLLPRPAALPPDPTQVRPHQHATRRRLRPRAMPLRHRLPADPCPAAAVLLVARLLAPVAPAPLLPLSPPMAVLLLGPVLRPGPADRRHPVVVDRPAVLPRGPVRLRRDRAAHRPDRELLLPGLPPAATADRMWVPSWMAPLLKCRRPCKRPLRPCSLRSV